MMDGWWVCKQGAMMIVMIRNMISDDDEKYDDQVRNTWGWWLCKQGATPTLVSPPWAAGSKHLNHIMVIKI